MNPVHPAVPGGATTGYTLVLGVVVPLSGWLADRCGMDRVLNLALILLLAGAPSG